MEDEQIIDEQIEKKTQNEKRIRRAKRENNNK